MHPVHNYQNALHTALRQFMEFESVTPLTRFLYPVIDRHRNPAARLLPLLEKLAYPLDASRQILIAYTSKKTLSAHEYAAVLCTLLADFYGMVPLQKLHRKKTAIPSSPIRIDAWKRAFAEKNAALFKKTMRVISPLTHPGIAGFFLHGSLATLDYAPTFSDFDSVLIIKKTAAPDELVSLRKKLVSAYARMYAIDPAQHHGVPVLYEGELSYYPEHYFPLAVFHVAVPLIPFSGSPSVFVRDDAEEKRALMEKNVRYFSALAEKNPAWMNAYDFKLFVAKVLLLPTLFLQAAGAPCLKKESFIVIKKHIPPAVCGVLDAFSALRRAWKKPYSIPLLGFFGNPFLPKIGTYLNQRRVPPFITRHAALFARTLEAKLHEHKK